MTHICVIVINIIGSDNGFVAWTGSSHYLNQWWNIVHWNLRNKIQWNFNRNSNIFIEENTFDHIVCERSAIFSRPQCVKILTAPPQVATGPCDYHLPMSSGHVVIPSPAPQLQNHTYDSSLLRLTNECTLSTNEATLLETQHAMPCVMKSTQHRRTTYLWKI